MKHILVIGNGFDIAHGLNTRYTDFLKFCNAISKADVYDTRSLSLAKLEQLLNESFSEKSVSFRAVNFFRNTKNIDICNRIVGICNKNIWIDVINENNHNNDKWSDFEYAIEQYIEVVSFIANNFSWNARQEELLKSKYSGKAVKIYDRILSCDSGYHNDFKLQISIFINYLGKELHDLTWLLEVYLTKFLNTKRKTNMLFEILPIDNIVSFNYTNTYQNIYKKMVETHFIHGIAKDDNEFDNNMVFGISGHIKNSDDDEYDYLEFQKYYQRIIKKTGSNYKTWLDNDAPMYIYFFGHSLDVMDGDVISELINSKSLIIIFYYDQKALNNLVANLAKILGKDKLIEFSSNEKIQFIKSDDFETINNFITQKEEFEKQKNSKRLADKMRIAEIKSII